jgi:hypothetical protein
MMSKHIEQLTEVKLTLNHLVGDLVKVTNKLGRIISRLDEEIGER